MRRVVHYVDVNVGALTRQSQLGVVEPISVRVRL
jgi:hypothetical protein